MDAIFKEFLDARKEKQPFYFWVGSREPHRPYEKDSWKKANRELTDAEVPPFLPDKEAIKGDLLDYGTEIEWYDSQLSRILDILKEKDELENTLIIVMADNVITCFRQNIREAFVLGREGGGVGACFCYLPGIESG